MEGDKLVVLGEGVNAYLVEEDMGSTQGYYVVFARGLEEAADILWNKHEELGWSEYEVSVSKIVPGQGWAGWVLRKGEETIYVYMSKVAVVNTLGEQG